MTISLDGSNGITSVTGAASLCVAGPAFSAYVGSNGSLSHNVTTKIPFNTETFDTNNNFDSTTNYRFTPTVAGYYQVNLRQDFQPNAVRTYVIDMFLYKNGSQYSYYFISITPGAGAEETLGLSVLVYMNGTTDYLEGYMYQYDYTAATAITYSSGSAATNFSASLVRSA